MEKIEKLFLLLVISIGIVGLYVLGPLNLDAAEKNYREDEQALTNLKEIDLRGELSSVLPTEDLSEINFVDMNEISIDDYLRGKGYEKYFQYFYTVDNETEVFVRVIKFNSTSQGEEFFEEQIGSWKNKSISYSSWELESDNESGVKVSHLIITDKGDQKNVYRFKIGEYSFFVRGGYHSGDQALNIVDGVFKTIKTY